MVNGLQAGLAITALGLGFRHGLDWDHLAALTDVTSTDTGRRRSMTLATSYVIGHALVVFVLGLLAIVLSAQLPDWVDPAMERVVGATLVLLGIYVVASLARHGRGFRLRSRWLLAFASARAAARWVATRVRKTDTPIVITHEHDHAHDGPHDHHDDHAHVLALAHPHAPTTVIAAHHHVHSHVGYLPDDPFPVYRPRTAFALGTVHGIGAETPTQVLVLLTAAHAGGAIPGVVLLTCFLAGLVAANTVVAFTAVVGFFHASRNFTLYAAISIITAVLSLIVGSLFLAGHASLLPGLAG